MRNWWATIFNRNWDGRAPHIIFTVRLVLFAAIIVWTNPGVLQRIDILIEESKWGGLAVFFGLWALSLAALAAIALQSNLLIRGFWAAVIAISGAAGYAFYLSSQTEISIYDVVSLWAARHEVSRAMSFYASSTKWAALVLIASFVVLMLPPGLTWRMRWRVNACLAISPVIPIAVFAALISMLQGNGSRALPAQLAPVSIGIVTGLKIASNSVPEREQVRWTAGPAKAKHVVLLVDESVRADYLDWTLGNPYTPSIAEMKDRLVNFGPAASGGNCSAYSNAILRFGGARHDLLHTVLSNATIWQYAKRAGFQTVFIDAQAAFIKKYSEKLQNFMTAAEAAQIDNFHALDGDVHPPALDDKLLDIILDNLRKPEPVFIYAVKNGAHFPYDQGYPLSAAEFRPIMLESDRTDDRARINSYRNVIKWSVDRILKRLLTSAELRDAVIIYTSDHGQNLSYKRLTHCTVDDPDPREGLVPLIAITGDTRLRSRFENAARKSALHVSHFNIVPTILDLFGYKSFDITMRFGPSLFEKNSEQVAFTSGDIFGLFSSYVRWHPLDLTQHYLESESVARHETRK